MAIDILDKNKRNKCSRHFEEETWRRRCGCIRTSDKLKNILDSFPAPPPPTPDPSKTYNLGTTCISTDCTHPHSSPVEGPQEKRIKKSEKSWRVIGEIVQLVQLSVTATALALYYLIYCYMQVIYYTLRSALYFHNADGAMKITIAIVTLTSLFIAFNILLKMERVLLFFR